MSRNVILNFTDTYSFENFYIDNDFDIIDCRDIDGTNCLCDDEAAKEINSKIESYGYEGIHFIDSGNYHYISKFWTDKISSPFNLVVFDHHPDMQESLFDGILSCGNWVTKVLETNSLVNKVLLIGPDDKLVAKVDNKYTDRVTFVCESEIHNARLIEENITNLGTYPIYISIDKDVLTKEEVQTNWDQGTLTTKELKKILSKMQKQHDILGVDICGTSPLVTFQMLGDNELINNNHINAELLKLFLANR